MNLSKKTIIVTLCFIAALVIVPSISSAKENDNKGKSKNESKSEKVKIIRAEDREGDRNDQDDDKNERKDNDKKSRTCIRAWGHLIAPGWIKKNGQLSLGTECYLPFGIGKKFRGNATSTPATTTPSVDATAPIISNLIATSTKANKATIKWTTNEKADSTVWYSTVSPVNTSGSASIVKTSRVTNHSIEIENLTASTTYYAIARSQDASGNTSTSSQISFTTGSADPIVHPAPVINNVVAIVGSTTVNVGWKTNIDTNSQVFYSTTTPVVIGAASTIAISNSTLTNDHIINVSGLATSTTYSFIIRSTSAAGVNQTTLPFSVTTSSGI